MVVHSSIIFLKLKANYTSSKKKAILQIDPTQHI